MEPVLSDQDYNNSSRIHGLPSPVSDDEPARKGDLDAAIEGLNNKDNVLVAAGSNTNIVSAPATIDGETPANGDRILLYGQTAASENGIYIYNGSGVAMTRSEDADTADKLRSAVVTVDEGTDAGNTYRQTQVDITLGTDDVLWTAFGSGVSQATETQQGKIEIADQAEADAGIDDQRAMTPFKAKNSALRPAGKQEVIGDGTATQYDVTHSWGTRNVLVNVYENSGSYRQVRVEARALDTNTVRIVFAAAPASNAYIVQILKVPAS